MRDASHALVDVQAVYGPINHRKDGMHGVLVEVGRAIS